MNFPQPQRQQQSCNKGLVHNKVTVISVIYQNVIVICIIVRLHEGSDQPLGGDCQCRKDCVWAFCYLCLTPVAALIWAAQRPVQGEYTH